MSQAFVIGAGFSKAFAHAPLADELFVNTYRKALSFDKKDRAQRKKEKCSFLCVVRYLQEQSSPLIDFLQQQGTRIRACEGLQDVYPIPIEYLCTILDLNIEHPFIPQGIGVDLQSCPIPYMGKLLVDHLREARRFILHSIVESLWPEQLTPKRALIDKVIDLIEPGDTIITFNYDILVEQALVRRGIWSPVDGYGIGEIRNDEELDQSTLQGSQVRVIKLHGSINWGAPDWHMKEIRIYTTHPLTNKPLFEGLKSVSKRPIPMYTDLFDVHAILPTFLKTARHKWEMDMIRSASEALSRARNVYILGYSFPEADAMANYIFTQIGDDAQIRIVDPNNAKSLAGRLSGVFGLSDDNIIHEQSALEVWVENGFQYAAYEKDREEQRYREKVFGLLNEIGPNQRSSD